MQVEKDAYALTVDDIASLLSESESSDIEAPSYSSLESADKTVTISDEEKDDDHEVLDEQSDVVDSARSHFDSISVSWQCYNNLLLQVDVATE